MNEYLRDRRENCEHRLFALVMLPTICLGLGTAPENRNATNVGICFVPADVSKAPRDTQLVLKLDAAREGHTAMAKNAMVYSTTPVQIDLHFINKVNLKSLLMWSIPRIRPL